MQIYIIIATPTMCLRLFCCVHPADIAIYSIFSPFDVFLLSALFMNFKTDKCISIYHSNRITIRCILVSIKVTYGLLNTVH
jgi:hypothetical protein